MTRAPVALVAIAGVVLIEACHPGGTDAFEREALQVEGALTASEGAKLLERGAARRNAMQVAQSWQLRVPSAGAPYAEALDGAMGRPTGALATMPQCSAAAGCLATCSGSA